MVSSRLHTLITFSFRIPENEPKKINNFWLLCMLHVTLYFSLFLAFSPKKPFFSLNRDPFTYILVRSFKKHGSIVCFNCSPLAVHCMYAPGRSYSNVLQFGFPPCLNAVRRMSPCLKWIYLNSDICSLFSHLKNIYEGFDFKMESVFLTNILCWLLSGKML